MRNFISLSGIIGFIASFCTFITIVMVPAGMAYMSNPTAPRAQSGFIDLSDWPFDSHHAGLHGEWEFYFGQFIPPDAFDNADFDGQPVYVSIPGSWKGIEWNGETLPGDGYGTFRLRVGIGKQPVPIGLSFTNVRTSFQAWIDGRPVLSKGTIGTTPDEAIPQTGFTLAGLGTTSDTIDIVLHVSNFSFREGGIARLPIMGDESRMLAEAQRSLAIDVFLTASLIIIGLYHFGIWLMRRQDVYTLYFALFCLCMATRSAVVGKIPLAFVFPFGWELQLKIEYIGVYLGFPLLALFLQGLFPHEINRRFTSAITMIGGVLSLIVVLTPARINSHTVIYFEVVTVISFLYLIFGIVRAGRMKREGARAIMVGTVIAFPIALHDMLFFWRVLGSQPLLPMAIFAFVIAHALIIAKRFSNEFDKQRILATENAALLRTVKGQVDEIKRSRRLMITREEETRQYVSDLLHGTVQSRLLSARHHLRSSSECLLKDISAGEFVDQGTRDALRHIRKASEQIDQMSREDVREISRLLHPLLIRIGLSPATRELVERFSEHFDVDLHIGERLARLEATDDEMQIAYFISLAMYRIIEEALNNAVKHAEASNIKVTIDLTDDDILYAAISDDGRGMDPSKVKRRLGFEMIAARAEHWGGTWRIESAVGAGTTIHVKLPVIMESTEERIEAISV